MKPKFACADFTFPLLSHDASLDLIASLGFKGVDVGLFQNRSHLWPSKEFKNIRKSAAQLKQKLDDRGLKPADVFLQADPDFVPYAANNPDPKRRQIARDLLLKTFEYANECGTKHVTALPGAKFDGVPEKESFKLCCEEMAWRVEQADKAKINFSIEAHIGSIVPRPQDAKKLVDAVPGLKLTLDYTHFTYLGLPDSATEPLIAHATHFHARGARKGRLQSSVKDNVIDYKRILQVMKETGYKGYVGVEYVWIDWQHCNEVDNISETVLLRDQLKQYAAELGA